MIRLGRRSLGGLVVASAFLGGLAGSTAAQTFSSGSSGADGPFNPPTTVPPGTTVSGSTVTVPLPPSGVFNFTTITVPSGTTVRFTRNPATTPVILLATGDVTLSGSLNVSGGDAMAFGRPGSGGPGGFDGGAGCDGITNPAGGKGLGPGGGGGGPSGGAGGGGGGYGGAGAPGIYISGTPGTPGQPYGSPALRPIVGGSGGGGGGCNIGVSIGAGGGGGGGAILVASSTRIDLGSSTSTQVIRAAGGNAGGAYGYWGASGGGGSGGAIRLIAPTIQGQGVLYAAGGGGGGAGGAGRIRVEATTLISTGNTNPIATTSLPQPVFPGAGQPTLTIARVGGILAPATPQGSFLAPPDIHLPTGTTNPVEIVLTASNIPVGTSVTVTATPQTGAISSATSTGLSGTLTSSTATASLTISLAQTSILVATATFPLTAGAGGGPIYAAGEEVTHVRVAAALGGPATVTYITRSGREIPIP